MCYLWYERIVSWSNAKWGEDERFGIFTPVSIVWRKNKPIRNRTTTFCKTKNWHKSNCAVIHNLWTVLTFFATFQRQGYREFSPWCTYNIANERSVVEIMLKIELYVHDKLRTRVLLRHKGAVYKNETLYYSTQAN